MSYKVNTSKCGHLRIYGNHRAHRWEKAHFQGPAADIRKHSLLHFYLIMTPVSGMMGCGLISFT